MRSFISTSERLHHWGIKRATHFNLLLGDGGCSSSSKGYHFFKRRSRLVNPVVLPRPVKSHTPYTTPKPLPRLRFRHPRINLRFHPTIAHHQSASSNPTTPWALKTHPISSRRIAKLSISKQAKLTDLRRIGLVRRPTSRQIRSVIGQLPRSLHRPQYRIFGGWFIDEVGHPRVPARLDLSPIAIRPLSAATLTSAVRYSGEGQKGSPYGSYSFSL